MQTEHAPRVHLLPETNSLEMEIAVAVPSANRIVAEGLALAVPYFARKGASPATVIRSSPEQRKTASQTAKEIEQRKILRGSSK